MFNILISQIGLILLVGTCVFSWIKGGEAERLAAVAIAITWIVSMAAQTLISPQGLNREIALLIIDGLFAISLLVISVRYSSLWLGVAMMLQSGAIACHALILGQEISGRTYFICLNIAGASMLCAVVVATFVSIHARSHHKRDDRDHTPPAMPTAV